MGRKKKINFSPKYLLMVLIGVCFVLIILSFKYESAFSPVKTSVGTVISPMQKGINSIGTFFSSKVKLMQKMNTLVKKNEKLQEQLDAINYDNKILQQEKYELDNLRDLYDLDQKYPSYPKVAARVIGRDDDNWYNMFTIDKGSEDGIQKDMNVMAGNGLVGIVCEVGKNYAKVRSIIDDDSNVSAMFLKTSDSCNVYGDLESISSEGTIGIEYISKDAQISDGYEVVTSHISPKFLQGILIGYVSEITMNANNTTQTAKLTPVVDFDKLETVLVITQLKDATELEDVLNYDKTKN